MAAEPGFISSHTASTGTAFVQNAPDIQAVNGETSVAAGTLMSIRPSDGKAYKCGLATRDCISAGFAATDHPVGVGIDCTEKITLIRQGRIKGFTGLVPGAFYYPSAVTPGAIVPERGTSGPVITSVTASSGAEFLKNVHIRAGARPAAGNWTVAFPSATSCTITPPSGTAGAAVTVADDTAYNGTITGAGDFYIETGTLAPGDTAVITVSYTAEAAAVITLASPGNAIASAKPIDGIAGTVLRKGLYKIVTTSTTVTVGFNGGSQSDAKTIAAGGVYFDIIPGLAITFEGSAVTAETNYIAVDVQEHAAPCGIAVNSTTLQVLMGGNC